MPSGASAVARGVGWFALVVLGVLALVAILTAALRPAGTTPPVMSDVLGPESGESVAEYQVRAAQTLDMSGPAEASAANLPREARGERWALVSLDSVLSVDDAGALADGAGIPRISQALIHAPVADVSMPVLPAVVAAPGQHDTGQAGPLGRAAATIVRNEKYSLEHPGSGVANAGIAVGGTAGQPDDARLRAQVDYTEGEVRAGRPVVAGLIVRAPSEALGTLADRPGVRAVEALPADAAWGRFGVRPLLPEQREAATPLPDTGEVPAPAGP